MGVGGALILLALGLCCLKRRRQQVQRGAVQDNTAAPTSAGYFGGVPPAEQKYHLVEAPTNLNEPVELPSGPQSERHELESAHK